MDNAVFWQAIKDRAATDTGIGGLFYAADPLIEGIYPNFAPSDLATPYIVFDIASATASNGFKLRKYDILCRFGIWVPKRMADQSDPLARASAIIARLAGDFVTSTQTAPTYGFDTHKLVLGGGVWTGSYMMKVASRVEHEAGWYHFIEEYETIVQR